MTKIIFWTCFAGALLAAAWLLMTPRPAPSMVPIQEEVATIQVHAINPWLIGDLDDAFSYAGEQAVIIEGEANLKMDPLSETGILEFTIHPDEDVATRLELQDVASGRLVTLRFRLQDADNIWSNLEINKGRNVGDARLPVTDALYAGSGTPTLVVDEYDEQPTPWIGFWSIGDALRQDDGSIRNQGLVFSPLLRDPSIFADPSREELTLLVYESSDSDVVLLHLVFAMIQPSGF